MCTLVSIQKSLSWGKETPMGINRIVVARFSKAMAAKESSFLDMLDSCQLSTESNAVGTLSWDLTNLSSQLEGDNWSEKAKSAMRKIAQSLCSHDVNTSFEDEKLLVNAPTNKVVIYSFAIADLVDCEEVLIASTGNKMRTRVWCERSNVSKEDAFAHCRIDATRQLANKSWKKVILVED